MEISQKIIDYAIWYYLKYYPSPKKLEEKLFSKFGPESEKGKIYGGISIEEINYILKEKMQSIIQEEEVIHSKIRFFIQKGKSKKYIKQKLFERREDMDKAIMILETYFENGEKENIKRELNKILSKLGIDLENIDFEQKNKVIQKLLLKGFDYREIKELF